METLGSIALKVEGDFGDVAKQLDKVLRDRSIDLSPKFEARADRVAKQFGASMEKSVSGAMKAGMSVQNVRGTFDEIRKLMLKAAEAQDVKQMRALEKRILAEEKAIQKTLDKQDKARKKFAQAQEKDAKRRSISDQKMAKYRAAAVRQNEDLQDQGLDDRVKAWGDGLESTMGKLKNMDFQGLTSGAGGGLKSRGKVMQGKADMGMGGGGKQAAAMKGVGKAMVGIGVALGAVAAVVGVIAMVAKTLIDAESQAKEFNKTIMETGGIGSLAFGSLDDAIGNVGKELDLVRESATDMRFHMKWMSTPKEIMGILKGFNESNAQLRGLVQHLDEANERMQRYQDLTSTALTYSKLLGVSAEQMATDMGDLMSDQATTLDQIQSGFHMVASAAQESGFNVKKFYSAVLEATSGMHFYNVSLQEAAGLLLNLSKALGKKPAEDFMKSLTQGFGDKSYTERFKNIMTTGGKKTARILAASAENMAEKINVKWDKSLSELGGRGTEQLGDVMKDVGVEGIEDLGKMTEEQFSEALAKMKQRGVGGELLQEITSTRQLAKGAEGGLGDKAKGIGVMGMGGNMAMQMNLAAGVLGKPLHEMGAMQLAAFEEISGISGTQLETLRRLSRDFEGNYKLMQKQSKMFADMGARDEGTLKIQRDQVAASGHMSDTQGNIWKITQDQLKEYQKEVARGESEAATAEKLGLRQSKNMEEFIVNQEGAIQTEMEANQEAFTKDQALAADIAKKTESITKVLEAGIQVLLEKLYNVLTGMFDWIVRADPASAAARKEAVRQQDDVIKAINDDKAASRVQRDALEMQKKEKKISAENYAAESARLDEVDRLNSIGGDQARDVAGRIEGAPLKKNWMGDWIEGEGMRSAKEFTKYGEVAGGYAIQAGVSGSGEGGTGKFVKDFAESDLAKQMGDRGFDLAKVADALDGVYKAQQFEAEKTMAFGANAYGGADGDIAQANAETLEKMRVKAMEDALNTWLKEGPDAVNEGGWSGITQAREGAASGEPKTAKELLAMTAAQLAEAEEQAKLAKEDPKRNAEEFKKGVLPAQAVAIAKEQAKQSMLAEANNMATTLGVTGDRRKTFVNSYVTDQKKTAARSITASQLSGKYSGFDPASMDQGMATTLYRAGLATQATIGNALKSADGGGKTEDPVPEPGNDFIYTSDGRLIKPNAADTLLGFKAGGPIEKAMGGGGGAKSLTFYISEARNPERTKTEVLRILRQAELI